jgi:hypothetical protein
MISEKRQGIGGRPLRDQNIFKRRAFLLQWLLAIEQAYEKKGLPAVGVLQWLLAIEQAYVCFDTSPYRNTVTR